MASSSTQVPAPLSAAESAAQDSLGYLVRQAYRTFTRTLNDKLSAHGIPSSNWSALRALWVQDGCSQIELAERLRVEKPSLGPVLLSLQRKGLVTLERNTQDRRKTVVRLTPAGRDLKQHILPYADEVNREATVGLTDAQVRELKRMLGQLVANLQRSGDVRA